MLYNAWDTDRMNSLRPPPVLVYTTSKSQTISSWFPDNHFRLSQLYMHADA
jgi:hypothetical protein